MAATTISEVVVRKDVEVRLLSVAPKYKIFLYHTPIQTKETIGFKVLKKKYFYRVVAKWIRHLFPKQKIAGSNPVYSTIKISSTIRNAELGNLRPYSINSLSGRHLYGTTY